MLFPIANCRLPINFALPCQLLVLSLTLYFALSALSKLSYNFPGAVPQAFIFRAVGAAGPSTLPSSLVDPVATAPGTDPIQVEALKSHNLEALESHN